MKQIVLHTGLLIVLFGGMISQPSFSEDLQGEVSAVIKGDFLKIKLQQEVVVYRLFGIDLPEKGQPFAKEAQDYASHLAVGRKVTIHDTGKKQDGINEVVITLEDGTVLNQKIVESGFAWWDDVYAPDDVALKKAFQKAQSTKIGLWADPSPIAPWEFRHDPTHPQSVRMDEPVFLTKKDFMYHRSTCRLLARETGEKTKITRGKAQEIGYYACTDCFPETRIKYNEIKYKGDFDKEPPKPPVQAKPGTPPPSPASGKEATPTAAEQAKDVSPEELIIKHGPSFPTDSKGNVLGLTANNIAEIPYAGQLGFQNGDILAEVNGVAVSGPDKAYQIYNQFKDARSINIKIIRNGSPVNMNVNIPR